MKTLDIIQKLAKVGKILCKIIFICCIVGVIGCAVGIVSFALIPDGIRINGVTIHSMIEASAEVSIGTIYAAMAAGLVLCAGEAALCRVAGKYFEHELAAGTPFTFDGAKEMMRLGVFVICVPLVTRIVAAVVCAILSLTMAGTQAPDMDIFTSGTVGLGVMFVLSGLLCRHGAEISNGQSEKTEE